MKKLIFTIVCLCSVGMLSAFAASYKTLYDCTETRNSNTIFYSEVDPFASTKNVCSRGNNDYYQYCVSAMNKAQQNILRMYHNGQCKKSAYQISGQYNNTACSYNYDIYGKNITSQAASRVNGSKMAASYYSADTPSQDIEYTPDEKKCYENLAKTLRLKYPNIKGNKEFGFK